MSYVCPKCNMCFTRKFNKDRHMENSKNCSSVEKKIKCTICDNTYRTPWGLQRHVSRKHSVTNNKEIQIDIDDDSDRIPLSKDTIYKVIVKELRSNEKKSRKKIMAKIRQCILYHENCETDKLLGHIAEHVFNNPKFPELMNFCIKTEDDLDTYYAYYGNNTWIELEELEIINILKSAAICIINEREEPDDTKLSKKSTIILQNEKIGLPSEFKNTREIIRNFYLSTSNREFDVVERDLTKELSYIRAEKIKEEEKRKKELAEQDRIRQDYDIKYCIVDEPLPVEEDPLKIDDVSTNGRGNTYIDMEEEDEYIPSEQDDKWFKFLENQYINKKRLELAEAQKNKSDSDESEDSE